MLTVVTTLPWRGFAASISRIRAETFVSPTSPCTGLPGAMRATSRRSSRRSVIASSGASS